MYYGKYLETWGRGIELMNDECALAYVPKPEFEVSGGCFKATFVRNDYIWNVAAEVNDWGEREVNKLTETEKKYSTSFPQIQQLQYLRLRRPYRCQERTPTNI